MKKIHFLENDYKCPSSDDSISHGKRILRRCGFSTEFYENMEIHYQFHLMNKDDVYKIIFNENNILVTYSMYVSGSDRQILSLLESAGRNDVKNIIYIDASGELIDLLNRELKNNERLFAIGSAINTNNILTYDYQSHSFKRLKFNIQGYFENCVVLDDFDITKLN